MIKCYSWTAAIVLAAFLVGACGGGSSGDGETTGGETTGGETTGGVDENALVDGVIDISYSAAYSVSDDVNGIGAISNSFDPVSDAVVQVLSVANASAGRICTVAAQNVGNQSFGDPFNEIALFQLDPLVSQNDITVNGRTAVEKISTTVADDGTAGTQLSRLYFFPANQTSFGSGLAILAGCVFPSALSDQFGAEAGQILSTLIIR